MRGQLRSERLKERKVKYHIRLKQREAQYVYGDNLVQKITTERRQPGSWQYMSE